MSIGYDLEIPNTGKKYEWKIRKYVVLGIASSCFGFFQQQAVCLRAEFG